MVPLTKSLRILSWTLGIFLTKVLHGFFKEWAIKIPHVKHVIPTMWTLQFWWCKTYISKDIDWAFPMTWTIQFQKYELGTLYCENYAIPIMWACNTHVIDIQLLSYELYNYGISHAFYSSNIRYIHLFTTSHKIFYKGLDEFKVMLGQISNDLRLIYDLWNSSWS